MSSDKSDKIKKLCDEWINAARDSKGGLTFGKHTEKFRLRKNGISFPELTFNELRAACIGLTDVLIHKGLNTIIDEDHLFFWAWIAELVVQDEKYFSIEEIEIRNLFASTFRIGLSSPLLRSYTQSGPQLDTRIIYILTDNVLVLSYLSFPLLEALLKKLCRRFVAYDGKVLIKFYVPEKNSLHKRRPVEKKCSSIRDLLFLLYEKIADDELKRDSMSINAIISNLDNGRDGFDIIGDWRNSSLHGQTFLPAIGGTILNLISLLILHSIRKQYDDSRNCALRNIQYNMDNLSGLEYRSPWSFYPPF